MSTINEEIGVTLKRVNEAYKSNFSYFTTFEEQLDYEKRRNEGLKVSAQYTIDIFKRLKKLVADGRPNVLLVKDYHDLSQNAEWLDIHFVLPKIAKDYIRGFNIWKEDKTWNNFKFIFSPIMIFGVLTVERKDPNVLERNIFDLFTIQTNDEYFDKSDVIKYSRMWIQKYFPNHNLKVEWLEGITE